jgi:hypothetical protein
MYERTYTYVFKYIAGRYIHTAIRGYKHSSLFVSAVHRLKHHTAVLPSLYLNTTNTSSSLATRKRRLDLHPMSSVNAWGPQRTQRTQCVARVQLRNAQPHKGANLPQIEKFVVTGQLCQHSGKESSENRRAPCSTSNRYVDISPRTDTQSLIQH